MNAKLYFTRWTNDLHCSVRPCGLMMKKKNPFRTRNYFFLHVHSCETCRMTFLRYLLEKVLLNISRSVVLNTDFLIFWTFDFTQQTFYFYLNIACPYFVITVLETCYDTAICSNSISYIGKTSRFLLPHCCLSNFCRLLVRAVLELRFNFHNNVTCQAFSTAVDWLTS